MQSTDEYSTTKMFFEAKIFSTMTLLDNDFEFFNYIIHGRYTIKSL